MPRIRVVVKRFHYVQSLVRKRLIKSKTQPTTVSVSLKSTHYGSASVRKKSTNILMDLCMISIKIVSTTLTLQLVMFWVGWKGPVWEQLCEADTRVLWLVHHIVPNSLHQSVHKLQTGRAQNLDDLIPLVDVWTTGLLWKYQLHYGHVHVAARGRI